MACSCGLVGSLLLNPGSATAVYSNPAPRGGAAALMSFDVLQVNSSVGIDLTVQTKKRSSQTWLDLATYPSPIKTTGLHTLSVSAFEDDYRLKWSWHAGSSAGDSINVFIPQPAWRIYG